jgi:hypothetical protein
LFVTRTLASLTRAHPVRALSPYATMRTPF